MSIISAICPNVPNLLTDTDILAIRKKSLQQIHNRDYC